MNTKLSNTGADAPHSISLLGAWALSFGCAVGWGSFMMPGNSFLPVAGPLGTVLGIAVGALIMLIVGVNYSYMLRTYPDAGGAYSYVKHSFDLDHGFVAAWFLLLTYVAVIWANATALPLIGRFLLGSVFQHGLHYRIAGFDIYLGELLLAIGALVVCSLLCLRARAALRVQIVMALLLFGGVLVCSVSVFSKLEGGLSSLAPAFAPGRSPVTGVLTIVAMAPWAFVGFESISHSAPEFRFSTAKALPVMGIALLTGAAAYSLLAVIAATTQPAGFESWPAYIAALGDLDINEAAPTFYAVRTAMGPVGTPVLVFTVLGGVITGGQHHRRKPPDPRHGKGRDDAREARAARQKRPAEIRGAADPPGFRLHPALRPDGCGLDRGRDHGRRGHRLHLHLRLRAEACAQEKGQVRQRLRPDRRCDLADLSAVLSDPEPAGRDGAGSCSACCLYRIRPGPWATPPLCGSSCCR